MSFGDRKCHLRCCDSRVFIKKKGVNIEGMELVHLVQLLCGLFDLTGVTSPIAAHILGPASPH